MKKVLYIIIPLVLIAIVVIKLKSNKEIVKDKVYQYDKNMNLIKEWFGIRDTAKKLNKSGQYLHWVIKNNSITILFILI